ncbi:MAG: carbohydrate ABC transporter permease [Spirochaetaceae bacterium]|nr:carbohydrate ABC transporter permease [Spirochaetaceae bacterium]
MSPKAARPRLSPAARGRLLPLPLRVFVALVAIVTVLATGIPVLNVLAVSFSSRASSENPGLVLLPAEPTLEGYSFVWSRIDIWRPFLNTAGTAIAGTVLHGLLAALAGYVLLQEGMPLRKALTTFVILTMTVPGELTLVSIYAVNKEFHLINTYAGLVLNGAVSGFSVLLMRDYFKSIPSSLAESARMDGWPESGIFLRIFLPLAKPGLATVATLELMRRWNNIAMTVTLISDMKKTTLPVILRSLLFEMSATSGQAYVFANAKMAAVVIAALPLVILYLCAQRFFVSGALAGSVKG